MLDQIKFLEKELIQAKSKQDYAMIHNQINELQDSCTHEFEVDGKYKVCIHCNFMDVYIKRKRKSKKSDTELF